MRTAQRAASGFMTELDRSVRKRQALDDLGTTAGKVGRTQSPGSARWLDEAPSPAAACTYGIC